MESKQAVILAGGHGLRLQELTKDIPKALLPIGDRAILDHILYHLSLHDVSRIVIAGGYRFSDLSTHGFMGKHYGMDVELVDTGENTNTAGRVKALKNRLMDAPFVMTWCDALSDLDFSAMYHQHAQSDALITLGAVHPPPRFGDLILDGNHVSAYAEKPQQSDRWISGGYFVVEPSVLELIAGPESSWEHDVLTHVARARNLQAYRHHGAWQCMDTLYEHEQLNALFESGQVFWPVPENS